MEINKFDIAYMKMAQEWANMSHCERRKVGCLLVKDKTIISDGYNGTPRGFENACELDDGTTKWYVLHAETNAIAKIAKSNQDSEGSTLYVTLSPCTECAKLIYQSGIIKVFYLEEYRDTTGLEFLRKAGIECIKIQL